MRIDAISIGIDPPREVNVIIEVPVGGEPIKYEMDKDAGTLVVDRFLYTAMRYPGNYGFIPHTLSGDGDPVDVLVANSRAIAPGAVMSVRPVGVLLMEDNAGQDEKIIAVPSSHGTAMIFSSWPALSSISSTPTGRTLITAPGAMARELATSTSTGSPSPDRVWGMKP